jgi:hypothetical protein
MISTDSLAKKPKQHYVWRKYLGAWTEDGALYCLLNGKIFATGPSRVAFENKFYGLKELTDQDLRLLTLLLRREGAHPASKAHEDLVLRNVLGPLLVARQNPQILKSPQMAELIEAHSANAIDDQHTVIEAHAVPLLDRLLREDISWFNERTQAISFCAFLAAQNMRTKKVKQRTVQRIQGSMSVDISRIWDIFGLILSFRLGASIFLERTTRPPVLVRNETGVDFITSDQPVINLDGDGHNAPESMTLFYPVSPRLALWIGDSGSADALSPHGINVERVTGLNVRMAGNSFAQVYGRSRASLESIQDAVS